MRKTSFVFITLILELLIFQNAYSEEDLRPLVFWRVYIMQFDNEQLLVTVDSVFRTDFYIKEKFKIFGIKEYSEKQLKPNAYYLVLARADCSQKKSTKEVCFLFLTEKNDLLPDTPENRIFLNKKIYERRKIHIDNSLGGSRSKAEIMEVINARRPELNEIYKEYLKLKPDFSGKVTLKFSIVSSGYIISGQVVGSTTDYPEFDNAIMKAVMAWKWKEKEYGNQTPTIPFNFTK